MSKQRAGAAELEAEAAAACCDDVRHLTHTDVLDADDGAFTGPYARGRRC